ncbi:MAG: hypothetical protein A4E39_00816 [Methanoregulaceae archaeon PtaB.Bin152]|nr:MAG: hypothetical protein A4E39_00816 [Methanoregulaceae archaeon PtaB.Bin152]
MPSYCQPQGREKAGEIADEHGVYCICLAGSLDNSCNRPPIVGKTKLFIVSAHRSALAGQVEDRTRRGDFRPLPVKVEECPDTRGAQRYRNDRHIQGICEETVFPGNIRGGFRDENFKGCAFRGGKGKCVRRKECINLVVTGRELHVN